MDKPVHFFVSFSSRDIKFVREITAALRGQDLTFWDYSDIIQSIELGEHINERLVAEIDACTHMIVVISKNSVDPNIGRFCRMELEYALNRNSQKPPHFFPVLIDSRDEISFDPPYNILKNIFCQELESSAESIVQFTVKVCQVLGKLYIPPIEAHPNLPFWKLFRDEVREMAHSNKQHIDIMIILGEFNEYYKKAEIQQALTLISFFLQSCNYKIPEYKPFYPWIVKAVCETELGNYDDAMKSYEVAKSIHPKDQNVIGGIGTIYFKRGLYQEAVNCFEQIINNSSNKDVTNARINLIITNMAMGNKISGQEYLFLFNLDISSYSSDLQTAISNAKGIYLHLNKDYPSLENLCEEIINEDYYDTITIRLLQLSLLNQGLMNEAKEIINRYIIEAENNSRLDRSALINFLEDCN